MCWVKLLPVHLWRTQPLLQQTVSELWLTETLEKTSELFCVLLCVSSYIHSHTSSYYGQNRACQFSFLVFACYRHFISECLSAHSSICRTHNPCLNGSRRNKLPPSDRMGFQIPWDQILHRELVVYPEQVR